MDPSGTEATTEGAQPSADAPKGEALEAKKAALLAKVRGQRGGSEPGGAHNPERAGSTPAAATSEDGDEAEETTKPDKPVKPADKPADAPADKPDDGDEAATARIAALTKQVAELQKLTERAKVADEYESLRERIKRDPSAVLDAFEGLGLEEISEAYLKRQQNPAHAQLTEQEKKHEELKAAHEKLVAELAAEKQAGADRAAAEQGTGILSAEAERWPIASREENRAEAVHEALLATRKVAAKMKGPVSDEKAEAIFRDCLDGVEKDFEARGQRYSRAPPKAGEKPRLRTIAAPAGNAGDGARRPPAPEKLTKEQILERVRKTARANPST